MAGKTGIEVSIDQSKLIGLSKALKAEANSALLRKDLIANLRAAVQPGVSAVQQKLSAIPSGSTPGNPSLGGYLKTRVKTQVRLTGTKAGVRVRIPQTPNIRGFKMAARRLNRPSWRHPVYGKAWVVQISPIPGFFDDTLAARKEEYRAAVIAACRKMSWRLGRTL